MEPVTYKALSVNEWMDHLLDHPLPELMDDECVRALSNVRAEYGDKVSNGAGLEVRLTEDSRYIDYIMNIDTNDIPGVDSLWYELDYSAFKSVDIKNGDEILPCYFANILPDPEKGYTDIWDNTLPAMMGKKRATLLRPALDALTSKLSHNAYIKQIGSMSSRGELDIMRLVILFPSWDHIASGLKDIGWPGDTKALENALSPWQPEGLCAVNVDLGQNGVLPKIGIEVGPRWRNPLLVDKYIQRLEDAGLCLPEKARALRRWIRIRPRRKPFIQTLIAYYKLNYKDGRITEAKAYLEQTPYLHHHYFDAYEYPAHLDIELTREEQRLPLDEILSYLKEASASGIKFIRFIDPGEKEILDAALAFCRENALIPEVVKSKDDPSRIRLDTGNIRKLPDLLSQAAETGAQEIIITGMDSPDDEVISKEDLQFAAVYISESQYNITVDSCFSPLRAIIGGEDPRTNPNRGIYRGCTAGRAFFAIRADGSFTPCLKLNRKDPPMKIPDYWENLVSELTDTHKDTCKTCGYKNRCLPCPLIKHCKV